LPYAVPAPSHLRHGVKELLTGNAPSRRPLLVPPRWRNISGATGPPPATTAVNGIGAKLNTAVNGIATQLKRPKRRRFTKGKDVAG
jgi:hypothetical protein